MPKIEKGIKTVQKIRGLNVKTARFKTNTVNIIAPAKPCSKLSIRYLNVQCINMAIKKLAKTLLLKIIIAPKLPKRIPKSKVLPLNHFKPCSPINLQFS